MISFIQPTYLSFDNAILRPLEIGDFEALYAVASDPLIWEQHPNKDRYQRPVFETYFKGAIESNMAYIVSDQISGDIVGCSRYYDFKADNKTISIGYTFLSRNYWGKSFNKSLKTAMLYHAFKFVESVIFHVGHQNIRSQKAMEKLGAIKTGEEEMSYYGEVPHTNFIYTIEKNSWILIRGNQAPDFLTKN